MNIKKIFQTRKNLESRLVCLEHEIAILKDQNRRLHFSVDILLANSLRNESGVKPDDDSKHRKKVA